MTRMQTIFTISVILLQVSGLFHRRRSSPLNAVSNEAHSSDMTSDINIFLLAWTIALGTVQIATSINNFQVLDSVDIKTEFTDMTSRVWNISWMIVYLIYVWAFFIQNKRFSSLICRAQRLIREDKLNMRVGRSSVYILVCYILIGLLVWIFDSFMMAPATHSSLYNSLIKFIIVLYLRIYYWVIEVAYITFFTVIVQVFIQVMNLSIAFLDAYCNDDGTGNPLHIAILNTNDNLSKTCDKVFRQRTDRNESLMMHYDVIRTKLFKAEILINEVFALVEQLMSVFGIPCLFWVLYGTASTTMSLYFLIENVRTGSIQPIYIGILVFRASGIVLLAYIADSFDNTVSLQMEFVNFTQLHV